MKIWLEYRKIRYPDIARRFQMVANGTQAQFRGLYSKYEAIGPIGSEQDPSVCETLSFKGKHAGNHPQLTCASNIEE